MAECSWAYLQLGLFGRDIYEQVFEHGFGSCSAAAAVGIPGMLQTVGCQGEDQLTHQAGHQLLIWVWPIAWCAVVSIQAIFEKLLVPLLAVKACRKSKCLAWCDAGRVSGVQRGKCFSCSFAEVAQHACSMKAAELCQLLIFSVAA